MLKQGAARHRPAGSPTWVLVTLAARLAKLKVMEIKNLRVGYSHRTGFLYRVFTVRNLI